MQHPQPSLASTQLAHDDSVSTSTPPGAAHLPRTANKSSQLQAPGRLFKQLEPRAQWVPSPSSEGGSTKEVPDWLPESQTRHVVPGVVADYDSLLLTHPDEVSSWPEKFRYDNREIAWILQFFEQVGQLKGQQYIRTILQTRTDQALEQRHYDELDELDPLRLFREQRGVPPKGFVLQTPIDGARPQFKDDHSLGQDGMQSSKHGQREGDQILGFAKSHDPVPVGTTLSELVEDYPNHLKWEFLDAFLQQGVTGRQFVKAIEGKSIKKILDDAGFWAQSGPTPRNHESFVRKNMRLRRDELIAKYGVEAAHAYLNSPIKLRELGEGIQLGHNTDLYSDIKKYIAGKTQKIKRQATEAGGAEEEGQRHAAGHGMQANTQTQRPPSISFPSRVSRTEPINWSQISKGKGKAIESPTGQSEALEVEEPEMFDGRLSEEGSDARIAGDPEGIAMPAVQVSLIPSEALPLGKVAGHDFWTSVEEHDTHVRTIATTMERTLELARQIIDRDQTTAHLLGDDKTLKTAELLQSVSNRVQRMRYAAFRPITIIEDNPPLNAATFCRELELEVRLHLAKGVVGSHNLKQPTVAGLQQLKQEATRRQIELHRAQAQVWAGAIEAIIRGDMDQFHRLKAADDFDWAVHLVQANTSTLPASRRRLEFMRRGFGHYDPLTTAIALELKSRIVSKYGADLADLELLRARQKEATAYLHALTNPTNAADAGIPLAASLREDAMRRTREIIQQTESDLLKQGEAAESGTPDGNDEPTPEDQQRQENWERLESRNMAHNYLPQDFTTDLGGFLGSGRKRAMLSLNEEEEFCRSLPRTAAQPRTPVFRLLILLLLGQKAPRKSLWISLHRMMKPFTGTRKLWMRTISTCSLVNERMIPAQTRTFRMRTPRSCKALAIECRFEIERRSRRGM